METDLAITASPAVIMKKIEQEQQHQEHQHGFAEEFVQGVLDSVCHDDIPWEVKLFNASHIVTLNSDMVDRFNTKDMPLKL